MPASRGTLDEVRHIEGEDGAVLARKRRRLYRVTTTVLCLIVGLAVLDAVGLTGVYGVKTRTVRAEGAGLELEVRYPGVARPALAAPFEITLVRPGGFDGPVTVAVTSDYLAIWDANGLDPEPSSSTTDAQRLLWEFEPPDGDTLVVSFDARIEPGMQQGKSGRVEVLDDDGATQVAVDFRTRVLP
ncbi:MAG TPA: hypothetical protein VFO65_01545 [Acidimicrobiales bacterium]|nr:hypothetical protein [Acidimicrobiales bacterium]